MRELLRRLTYLLGYQNFDHLALVVESRMRRVDAFSVVRLGHATCPAFLRGRVTELAMSPSITHIDLLCADDVTSFDFDLVLPSIVHVTRTDAATVALLQRHGYDVMVRAEDLVAHRRKRLAV